MNAPVIKHWLTVVTVECPQCGPGSTVMLVGAVLGYCPTCHEPFAVGSFHWDSATQPVAVIEIGQRERLSIVS